MLTALKSIPENLMWTTAKLAKVVAFGCSTIFI